MKLLPEVLLSVGIALPCAFAADWVLYRRTKAALKALASAYDTKSHTFMIDGGTQ